MAERRARGFTLLEVLLTSSMVLVVFTSCMLLLCREGRWGRSLEDRTRATTLCLNVHAWLARAGGLAVLVGAGPYHAGPDGLRLAVFDGGTRVADELQSPWAEALADQALGASREWLRARRGSLTFRVLPRGLDEPDGGTEPAELDLVEVEARVEWTDDDGGRTCVQLPRLLSLRQ